MQPLLSNDSRATETCGRVQAHQDYGFRFALTILRVHQGVHLASKSLLSVANDSIVLVEQILMLLSTDVELRGRLGLSERLRMDRHGSIKYVLAVWFAVFTELGRVSIHEEGA